MQADHIGFSFVVCLSHYLYIFLLFGILIVFNFFMKKQKKNKQTLKRNITEKQSK